VTCGDLCELLSAYVDGEVSPAQREWLELHLERCSTCQGRLGDYRRVRALLAALPGDSWAPAPRSRAAVRRARRGGVVRLWSVIVALALGLAAGAAGTVALRGGMGPAARGIALPVRVGPSVRPAPGPARVSGPSADVGERMARAVAAEALPETRSLPEQDRGAIVVLVYVGGSRRPVPDRRMTIYRVDDPVATWSALQQAVSDQTGESLPTGTAQQPASPILAWPRAPQRWRLHMV
jgi:anti-sigma factor RsiW